MQTTQVINDHHHHQPHHNHHTNGKLNGYQKGSNGSTVDPQTQTPQPPPTNGYNSNGRRDSGNVWLPLLPNDISINSDHLNSPSNNNDWKDTVEINNIKNGLLHNTSNNNGSLLNGKNGLALTPSDKYDEQHPLTGGRNNISNGRGYLYNEKPKADSESEGEVYGSDGDSESLRRRRDDDYGCGLFGLKPKWAQDLASTHMFMIVFLLAWILQGMFQTYFVSILTTIEKIYQIRSTVTGFLLAASECGQISTALLLTYYAGRGHRPRWIAFGMVLFSISAMVFSLPHFLYGDKTLKSLDTSEDFSSSMQNVSTAYDVCSISPIFDEGTCKTETIQESSKVSFVALTIFFLGLFFCGVGQVAIGTLGIPYIDDNVASRESPIYLGITIGVKILGPTIGFVLGSYCIKIFVDLSTPSFGPDDPHWIGAWWLGPIIISSLMLLASLAMFSFPKELKKNTKGKPLSNGNGMDKKIIIVSKEAEKEEKPKLRDFPKTLKRQFKNDILMFRTASSVFHLMPISGFYAFLPKYLESQFYIPMATSTLIIAFGGILPMGFGVFISGITFTKIQPSARKVAAWIAMCALIFSAGSLILMFIGCGNDVSPGFNIKTYENEPNSQYKPVCSNVTCDCDKNKFSPICGVDGQTYYSSCHAGCSEVKSNGTDTIFKNCSCIDAPEQTAKIGRCDSNCRNFIVFVCIFSVCVFIHSTSEVGGYLLIMRCTDPKDKALALGLIQSAIGLLGNVPCPLIYGAVVDSACLVWTKICGKLGACIVYDDELFRRYFLGITSGIMFLALLMDLVVWKKAIRIDIAPQETEKSPDTACDNCEKSLSATKISSSNPPIVTTD